MIYFFVFFCIFRIGFVLIKGEKSFFLYPGERLEKGTENVYVLNEEQGLVVSCTEAFVDKVGGKEVKRKPGDRWMIRGPMEYVPAIGAKVLRINKAISLGENEGICMLFFILYFNCCYFSPII